MKTVFNNFPQISVILDLILPFALYWALTSQNNALIWLFMGMIVLSRLLIVVKI